MKTEDIAKVVHEANKAYCESIGDNSQQEWQITVKEIKDSAVDGVDFAKANPDVTPKEMHDNWHKDKLTAGWEYGKEKSVMRKTHPCMVDYEDLPKEQRVKDSLFLAIVNVLKDV